MDEPSGPGRRASARRGQGFAGQDSAGQDSVVAAEAGLGSTWTAILWRAGREAVRDRVTTIASGVAFFVVLAVFPGIAALVSLYGLFADPHQGNRLLAVLPAVLPEDVVKVIGRQIRYAAGRDDPLGRDLGIASLVGFLALLWGTNRGTKALFDGLNLIYGREEERGFLKLTAISLASTFGAVAFLVLAIGVILLLPAAFHALGLDEARARIVQLLRWPALLLVVALILALVYRYGPSRSDARWRWITLGSGVASVLWVLASLLFSWCVSHLGRLDELYGSLGAVISFMVWIWLSIIIVLLGAECDAAATGKPTDPMRGQRGPTDSGGRAA